MCLKSVFFSPHTFVPPSDSSSWDGLSTSESVLCLKDTSLSLSYTEFDSLIFCECLFLFLAKVLIEILFWQQKPKMNTGLCLLFLVLYDNNIVTSAPLQFMSSFFFIWQHATISWTQKYGEKGKRATVTGVQTLIDFQLQVLWAAAQKQAKREKKGPNTDKV